MASSEIRMTFARSFRFADEARVDQPRAGLVLAVCLLASVVSRKWPRASCQCADLLLALGSIEIVQAIAAHNARRIA
jgi:hypothetical protein